MKVRRSSFFRVELACSILWSNLAAVQVAKSALWITNAPMLAARQHHTATLLSNGKVLVAGGDGGLFPALSSAEIYDPVTGTWTAVTNMMSAQRFFHAAALLRNGQVYAAGGAGGIIKQSDDLYDPVLGKWTATGPMAVARYDQTATLLPNGLVL